VVAGHKRAGRADDPRIVEETRQYIRDFDRIAETTKTRRELHDQILAIYERQQQLTGEHLHAHAQALGLDLKRFDHELADNVYAPRVRDDFMSGVGSGVNGTPIFFINGVRLAFRAT
jgi:predicted DsbA family dithiol-disulfide isomerase